MQKCSKVQSQSKAFRWSNRPGRGTQRVRVYAVRWSKIRDAMHWLKQHNPAFEHVDIQIPLRILRSQICSLMPENFNNAPFQHMHQFMQTDNQPQFAEDAWAGALGQSTRNVGQQMQEDAAAAQRRRKRQPRHFVLERLDGQPLSLYDQKNIEALSFLKLFPTCQNHYGTARDIKVSNSAYAKTR